MDMIEILAVAVTMLAVGGALGWWIASRNRPRDLSAELAASNANLENALRDVGEMESARRELAALNIEHAGLKATLEAQEKASAEKTEQLLKLREELQAQFKLLANDTLKENTEHFLKQATQHFENQKALSKSEHETRAKEIENLVKPLGDTLKSYDVALKEIEKARDESYGGIKQALNTINAQHGEVKTVTANLVNALRASPKTRGRWGEETLRRVMEMSGMVEHSDFETEKHFRGEDVSLRPDALIHVSGGRTIVIDAKAPISAYLDALNVATDEERETLLKRHASQLRERLANLSSKSYWEKISGSTDCVVMFVPGDNFVSAAFERDPDLFEDAIKSRVLICTPTTFIALAKAISYGWRQEKLAQNALDISKLGKELYARLATLGDHVAGLGDQINKAAKKYNQMVGSLESQVMPQARRFKEMGVEGTAEPIGQIEEVDTVVRFPQQNRDLLLTKARE
ncbi:MAG: DNA recombination protein RmuC [Rhizomicrobium sp.]